MSNCFFVKAALAIRLCVFRAILTHTRLIFQLSRSILHHFNGFITLGIALSYVSSASRILEASQRSQAREKNIRTVKAVMETNHRRMVRPSVFSFPCDKKDHELVRRSWIFHPHIFMHVIQTYYAVAFPNHRGQDRWLAWLTDMREVLTS